MEKLNTFLLEYVGKENLENNGSLNTPAIALHKASLI